MKEDIDGQFIHNPTAVKQITHLVQITNSNIAHLHNIYHQITPSVIKVLNRFGIKVVLTLHDYKIICPVYRLICQDTICTQCEGKHFLNVLFCKCQGDSLTQNMLLCLEAYFHRFFKSYAGVNLFITPSRFMQKLVCRFGLDKKRVRVIPNGIDPKPYSAFDRDEGFGLYAGRLSKEKGIFTLLNAHARLNGQVKLKFAGSGPLERELKQKYPDVEFLVFLNKTSLDRVMRKAAFIIVPSQWYENCSMSILEAMAYGKPVIGADIGGISEQVQHQKTGLLFTPGNVEELCRHILMMTRNPQYRRKLSAAAYNNGLREFSIQTHIRRLSAVINEIENLSPGRCIVRGGQDIYCLFLTILIMDVPKRILTDLYINKQKLIHIVSFLCIVYKVSNINFTH
ncbi:MAG: glycosyltransferase [Desulfobacteraceae bacterium]